MAARPAPSIARAIRRIDVVVALVRPEKAPAEAAEYHRATRHRESIVAHVVMVTETPPSADSARTEPRRGKPRLIAAGFLFAFGLSIVTVVLTGLWVRSPDRRTGDGAPPAAVREAPERQPPAAVERSAAERQRALDAAEELEPAAVPAREPAQ